ncbi:MAG TPA: hypothetical protein VK886_14925 [Vicinamibacterales bacterium]|nr:hypothetical protein [Vicinamibacterales bacterium]
MPMIADEPAQVPHTPKTDETANVPGPDAPATAPDATPAAETPTPALARFHSCRWRAQPEDGVFCTHRDVLPMAGKTGFNAESWCPDCPYFKVRRAPRKREYSY